MTQDAASAAGGAAASYGSPAGVYDTIDVSVPDIGDFKSVPVIEIHVQPGAEVKAEDPLLTLESDKATMDVPAPAGGTVATVLVKVGDRVSEGDTDPATAHRDRARPPVTATIAMPHAQRPPRSRRAPPRGDIHAEVLVLGAGPGGYSRRVPRRRSRQAGGAGRALADARRRVPQCRLHPVEGAAARRQGDRGSA